MLDLERRGVGEEIDPVGDPVADEEIGDGRDGKVAHDLRQGIDLILGPDRPQLQKGEARVHGQHHDGADQDEEDVGTLV